MLMRKGILSLLVAVSATFVASPVLAEYPERPITMIVAYSPGGGTDVLARSFAPFIEKYLGNDASFTIINKPGAGGEVGFTALSQSKPDGYTIGFLNLPNLLAIPIERKARYSLDSFTPLANMVDDPGAFNVHIDSPFNTLAELVAYAKENPGSVTVGTSGVGGDDHLAMMAFAKQAGIKLTHVPFPGAAPNRTALLGRHITVGAFNVSEAIQYAKEGQIKILGQMAAERWEVAPDVPTFKEQGFDVIMGSQRGMGAPAGFPAEAKAKLSEAIGKAVNDPEFQAKAKKIYLPLSFMDADTYGAFLVNMNEQFKTMWAEEPWRQ